MEYQMDLLIKNKNDDTTTLSFNQQILDERFFSKIVAAIRSKEAWDILEMEYSEKGSNIN